MTKNSKKICLFALAIIAIACILFALPGQFLSIKNLQLNAYEFFFSANASYNYNVLDKINGTAHPSAHGIIIILFFALSIVCLIFHKKDALLELLAGIMLAFSAIFLFMMQLSVRVITGIPFDTSYCTVNWVAYVAGALVLVAAIALIWDGVVVIKQANKAYKAKAGYSYLKK